MNERFSSLLNNDPSSLAPGYTGPLRSLSSDGPRHQRPVSEILKPENFKSAETQVLDKWFEDLQQYESSLESMASASLDPKYKEEVQHVDQWFRYLNEAERTATIYTLLQHSTQVQIRFFITVLQQMSKKDPLAALLSPAHPEKVDMQAQLAGAMVKAELDASQKLLSVLPYQTGQVHNRADIGRRNHIDRHSFALGDTEEYDRLFARPTTGDFLTPRFGELPTRLQQQQQQQQRTMFEPTTSRPKSVIEGDISSIFSNDWSYGAGLVGHRQSAISNSRPKSADISNWSFGTSVSSKSAVREDPWSAISPTVPTFTGPKKEDQLFMSNNWHLNNTTTNTNTNTTTTRPSVILTDDTKGFRRRGVNRIPGTVVEADELKNNSMQSPPPLPPANIVLSVYDDKNTVFQDQQPTSPTKPNQYGQFLNPNRVMDENGYFSDHSDASNRSNGSKKKFVFRKENKNNSDIVDMQLLEDVPAWLRSLRLHKYNPIFETMKWQDMLKMDDEALLGKGVAALGARRKLLKVFDQVKAHCLANNITY
ncbi:hypothetical protein HPULCUR_001298 [Helicostylum pulchrum]|uniref:SAM domain-containing protein n=1 Tax=Helicostylum pulchrum TaxID=562976 RepID=A0ABP9XNC0_9FUNG